jgi:hypothetical protein
MTLSNRLSRTILFSLAFAAITFGLAGTASALENALENGVATTLPTGFSAVGALVYPIGLPQGVTDLKFELSGQIGAGLPFMKVSDHVPAAWDTFGTDYSCFAWGDPTNLCSIDGAASGGGTWYATVYGTLNGATLTASFTNPASTLLEKDVPQADLLGGKLSERRFHMEVPVDAENLTLELSGGTGDADLYVSQGVAPTANDSECRPFLAGNDEACSFAAPAAGTWHVMVRGFDAFEGVTLVADYELPDAPPPVGSQALQNGVPAFGITGPTERFHLAVPAGAEDLEFVLSGDPLAHLYVAKDRQPTTTDWDCISEFGDRDDVCTIGGSEAGTWHVLVQGLQAFTSATLVGSYQVTVPPEPVVESERLRNGVPRPGIDGEVNSEQRFHLIVPEDAETLRFELSRGTGDADLYVSEGREPTMTSFQCVSNTDASNAEVCEFTAPNAGTWHVLVHGFAEFAGATLLGEHDGTTSALQPISTRKLKMKQGTSSKVVLKAVDGAVFPPAMGSPEDPAVAGARLVVLNPTTGEQGILELPAGTWIRKPNGTLRSLAAGCKVVIKPTGKLNVRCIAAPGLTLDEQRQTELGIRLELGNEAGFCAGFGATPIQDWGVNFGPVAGKGVFTLANAPRPSACD